MSFYEIFILAIILSLDAFIVSFSYSLCETKKLKNVGLAIVLGTSTFQFLMPLLGAYLTRIIYSQIIEISGYLAGIIFIILGIKFYTDSLKTKNNNCCKIYANFSWKTLLLISIATSIDALAAGCSLYLLKSPILISSIIIGITTLFDSFLGFVLGKKIKNYAPSFFEKTGGILLILIGIKSIVL